MTVQAVGPRSCWIHDKFQKIAIGISHLRARPSSLSPALTIHRTCLHLGAGTVKHRLKGCRCPVPDKAEVAAWWFRGWCAESEGRVLPQGWPVEVDHLLAEV